MCIVSLKICTFKVKIVLNFYIVLKIEFLCFQGYIYSLYTNRIKWIFNVEVYACIHVERKFKK